MSACRRALELCPSCRAASYHTRGCTSRRVFGGQCGTFVTTAAPATASATLIEILQQQQITRPAGLVQRSPLAPQQHAFRSTQTQGAPSLRWGKMYSDHRAGPDIGQGGHGIILVRFAPLYVWYNSSASCCFTSSAFLSLHSIPCDFLDSDGILNQTQDYRIQQSLQNIVQQQYAVESSMYTCWFQIKTGLM